jgi:hypothetical protein
LLPGFPFLELGPAGTTQQVSTMMIQFVPTNGFTGQFVVEGRLMGAAANDVDAPFGPIPYRRITLANVAQEYAMVADVIVGAATIQIPANGMDIALQMAPTSAGWCDILIWDLQGSSAV